MPEFQPPITRPGTSPDATSSTTLGTIRSWRPASTLGASKLDTAFLRVLLGHRDHACLRGTRCELAALRGSSLTTDVDVAPAGRGNRARLSLVALLDAGHLKPLLVFVPIRSVSAPSRVNRVATRRRAWRSNDAQAPSERGVGVAALHPRALRQPRLRPSSSPPRDGLDEAAVEIGPNLLPPRPPPHSASAAERPRARRSNTGVARAVQLGPHVASVAIARP